MAVTDDEFELPLAVGTAPELAKALNITISAVYSKERYGKKTENNPINKPKKFGYRIIKLELSELDGTNE
jgi:hypothetical protein